MDKISIKYGFAGFILLIIIAGILFVVSNKPHIENIKYEDIPKPEEIKEINTPKEINSNVNTNSNIEVTQTKTTEINNTKNQTNEKINVSNINISSDEIPEPAIIPELNIDINISNNMSDTITEEDTIEIINLPSEI